MTIQEKLDFLKNFKSSEIYRDLERIRHETIRVHLENLAMPIKNDENIFDHCRSGGLVEGMKVNFIEELIEELKEKQREKGKE